MSGWTDVFCFTCSHEIRQYLSHEWTHIDDRDTEDCICFNDGERCQP